MSDRSDWMNEEPSSEHAKRVMEAASPILDDYRKRSRRGFFSGVWTWVGGGSLLAAGLAAIVFMRRKKFNEFGGLGVLADLEFTLESDTEVEAAELIATTAYEIDLEAIEDLDLLMEISEKELSS